MNEEIIDSNILIITDGLSKGIPEEEIIEAYTDANFNMADIVLLLTAAKLLLNDRKNAKPIKGSFKRIG